MTMFKEANQIRLQLKMRLATHSWYSSSRIIIEADDYSVIIGVKHLDNTIRKLIPQVIDGVSIKTELA